MGPRLLAILLLVLHPAYALTPAPTGPAAACCCAPADGAHCSADTPRPACACGPAEPADTPTPKPLVRTGPDQAPAVLPRPWRLGEHAWADHPAPTRAAAHRRAPRSHATLRALLGIWRT